jgi:hypothetical protein
MGKQKIYNKIVARSVYMENTDLIYLQSKGISITKLFNQAIGALKEGKLIYKFIEEKTNN